MDFLIIIGLYWRAVKVRDSPVVNLYYSQATRSLLSRRPTKLSRRCCWSASSLLTRKEQLVAYKLSMLSSQRKESSAGLLNKDISTSDTVCQGGWAVRIHLQNGFLWLTESLLYWLPEMFLLNIEAICMKILSRHWGTGKAITESDGLHQIQRDPEDGSGDEDCSWTSLALRLKIFYHFPDGAAFDATTSRDTDFKQQRLQHLTGFTDITSCVRLFFVSNVNKDIFYCYC